MSRTKRFLSGLWVGYLHQGLVMIVGLWLTPFLLSRIGKDNYGLWLVGTQILSYLALLDFGIIALLPREAAFLKGKYDRGETTAGLPKLLGEILSIVLLQSIIVAVSAGVFWLTLPEKWSPFRVPLTLVLITFVLLFPFRSFHALLEGFQETAYIGRVNILGWVVSTTIIITLAVNGFGILALALSWIASQATLTGAYVIRVFWKYPHFLPKRVRRLTPDVVKTWFSKSLWISLSQVSQILLAGTDLVMIGFLLGPSAVVVYSCTGKLTTVLSNQPLMIMQIAFPGLSEARATESKERLFTICTALSLSMLLLSGAIFCVILAVNPPFVAWWVGPGQFGGRGLSFFILTAMLLRHWNITLIYTNFVFGYERRNFIVNLADGLTTILVSLVAIHLFGLVGAPLGPIVGACCVSIPLNLKVLSLEIGVSPSTLLVSLRSWFWRFTAVGLVAFFGSQLIPFQGFWAVSFVGVCTGCLYLVIMAPVLFSSPIEPYSRPYWQALRRRLAVFLSPSTAA